MLLRSWQGVTQLLRSCESLLHIAMQLLRYSEFVACCYAVAKVF